MLTAQCACLVSAVLLCGFAASKPLSGSPHKRSVPKPNVQQRDYIMPHIVANPPITPSLLPAASDVTLMPNGIPASYGNAIHGIFRQHPNVFHAPNLLPHTIHGGFGGPHLGPHFGPNVGPQIMGPHIGTFEGQHFGPYEDPAVVGTFDGHHYAPMRPVLGARFPYAHEVYPHADGPVVGHREGLYHVSRPGPFVPHGRVMLGGGFHPVALRPGNHIYGENMPETVFLGGKHVDALHGGGPSYEAILRARLLPARRRYLARANAMNVYFHGPRHALWDYNMPAHAHATMEAPPYLQARIPVHFRRR